jgi:hypothetical protein
MCVKLYMQLVEESVTILKISDNVLDKASASAFTHDVEKCATRRSTHACRCT